MSVARLRRLMYGRALPAGRQSVRGTGSDGQLTTASTASYGRQRRASGHCRRCRTGARRYDGGGGCTVVRGGSAGAAHYRSAGALGRVSGSASVDGQLNTAAASAAHSGGALYGGAAARRRTARASGRSCLRRASRRRARRIRLTYVQAICKYGGRRTHGGGSTAQIGRARAAAVGGRTAGDTAAHYDKGGARRQRRRARARRTAAQQQIQRLRARSRAYGTAVARRQERHVMSATGKYGGTAAPIRSVGGGRSVSALRHALAYVGRVRRARTVGLVHKAYRLQRGDSRTACTGLAGQLYGG